MAVVRRSAQVFLMSYSDTAELIKNAERGVHTGLYDSDIGPVFSTCDPLVELKPYVESFEVPIIGIRSEFKKVPTSAVRKLSNEMILNWIAENPDSKFVPRNVRTDINSIARLRLIQSTPVQEKFGWCVYMRDLKLIAICGFNESDALEITTQLLGQEVKVLQYMACLSEATGKRGEAVYDFFMNDPTVFTDFMLWIWYVSEVMKTTPNEAGEPLFMYRDGKVVVTNANAEIVSVDDDANHVAKYRLFKDIASFIRSISFVVGKGEYDYGTVTFNADGYGFKFSASLTPTGNEDETAASLFALELENALYIVEELMWRFYIQRKGANWKSVYEKIREWLSYSAPICEREEYLIVGSEE